MGFLKYLIVFIIFFVIVYLIYYIMVIKPQISIITGKKRGRPKKKEKDLPPEVKLLRDYYKIDLNKIGMIRTLRIINFVNALFLSILALIVFPINEVWLKFVILVVLIMPTIWFVYYALAKYLMYLERKSDKNV